MVMYIYMQLLFYTYNNNNNKYIYIYISNKIKKKTKYRLGLVGVKELLVSLSNGPFWHHFNGFLGFRGNICRRVKADYFFKFEEN